MARRSKDEEYEICKQRGHASEYGITTSLGTIESCKYCGTRYYYERVLHETNVPGE